MSNQPNLKIIGKELLQKYNLQKYRQCFKFDFEIDFDNVDITNKYIKNFIKSKLKIDFDDNFIEIIHKKILEEGLNWHIDDCVIITKKSEPIYNKERYIKISDSKYLYFHNRFNRLPNKTILFYSSTFGIDFDGGILQFIDDTKIKPEKYTGLIFDSREAHCVTPVKSGNRCVSLIKIY
jgi:hypothetical protein